MIRSGRGSQPLPEFLAIRGRYRGRNSGFVHLPQPHFTPKNRAGLLASVMIHARAAQSIQQHHVVASESPQNRTALHARRANFHHAPGHAESLPAVFDHLPHKWKLVASPLGIQRLGNLGGSFYFGHVARPKSQVLLIHEWARRLLIRSGPLALKTATCWKDRPSSVTC